MDNFSYFKPFLTLFYLYFTSMTNSTSCTHINYKYQAYTCILLLHFAVKCIKFLFGLFHLSLCYLVHWHRFAIATYPSTSYMLNLVFQYSLSAVANLGCNCTLSIVQNFIRLLERNIWSICNCRVVPSLTYTRCMPVNKYPLTVNVI